MRVRTTNSDEFNGRSHTKLGRVWRVVRCSERVRPLSRDCDGRVALGRAWRGAAPVRGIEVVGLGSLYGVLSSGRLMSLWLFTLYFYILHYTLFHTKFKPMVNNVARYLNPFFILLS